MIKVENVFKSFGDLRVIQGLSLTLEKAEIVGVVGPSGSGKSVFLKLLAGVIKPDRGSIGWHDDRNNESKRGEVGMLFQEGALFDSMSVIENVAFPLFQKEESIEYGDAMERSYEILCEVGLGKAWRKLPGQLSGGMSRRVAIARALVGRPELALLDDPTGGLDPVAASVIMDLILELHSIYQPTVVMVSHDIRRLLPRASRVVGLFDGQVACDLPPSEMKSQAPDDVLSFLATRYDFDNAEASSG